MGVYKGTTVTTQEQFGTFTNPDNVKDGTDDTHAEWAVSGFSGGTLIDYIRLADFSPTLGTDENLDLELQWRVYIEVSGITAGYLEIFRRHSFTGGASWVQDDLVTLDWDDMPYLVTADYRQIVNTGSTLPASLVIEYIMRTVGAQNLTVTMLLYQLAVVTEDMPGITVIGEP